MELSNLNLPQNFQELSHRLRNQDVTQWSGAVNFLFVDDSLLLIKRSDDMPSHKGQIGFFGGHKSAGETEPIVTAKREWEEESGFSAQKLDVFGLHQPVLTSRRRMIIPVISKFKGSLDELYEGVVSNGEWSNLVAVKFASLEDDSLWVRASAQSNKGSFDFYFFPLLSQFSQYKTNGGAVPYTLWGASAKMILNFFKNPDLSDRFPEV